MIVLQQVSKYFGERKAVDSISFEVGEGETLVLLGRSGCGKTTTLRMINRLIEPTTGIITVNGENVLLQSPEKLRRGIGYVLQHHGLFPHYTVEENIEVVPTLLDWEKHKKQKRTIDLLEQLDLPYNQYATLYPHQLSGGQQQRVGVARALAADASVLLMDEPFGALDPITRTEIRKELIKLEEFKKKTIIMVTHDIQEAFAYGDRICLMDRGKIVQIGTPYDLLFKPEDVFVKEFLNEQRLQLELKTTSLLDLWKYFGADTTVDRNVLKTEMNTKSSVWDTMDALSKNERKHAAINVVHEETNELRCVDLQQLLNAYSNLNR
jgi:osmoprotectant transport system ATP-binding protein